MIKARKYTKEELKLFQNTKLTGKEIAIKLNISHITVSRMRQKLGIVTPVGWKKGRAWPARKKAIFRTCIGKNCKNKFEAIPSSKKRYCSRSCFMRTANNGPKGLGSRGIRNPNTPAYKRYARLVHGLSQKTYEKHINIINPKRHPRTICGVKGGWQLDHIISVKECFKKGMRPQEAADVKNLRMLPWKKNLMRYYAHR